jgi:hypothetical protein
MKTINMLIALIFVFSVSYSQNDFGKNANQPTATSETTSAESSNERHKFDIGFGFGLDYGGFIGAKISYVPIKHLAVFGSAGYHLVAFGWQVGVIGYILPKTTLKKFRPYGKFMYGTNRAIMVEGDSDLDKNYMGPTFGIGIEMRFGRKVNHGLNLDLNFPIASQQFKDDLQFLKDSPKYEVTDPLPVAISIGYHFEI